MRDVPAAVDYLRTCGPISLLKTACRRFLFHYQGFVVLELAFEDFVPPPNRARMYLPGLHIGRVSEGHVGPIMDLLRRHNMWRRETEFEEALQQPSAFLFAAHDRRLVAYACATPSVPSTHEFARDLALEPRCAYGAHAFVATAYRGIGVYPRLVDALVQDLRGRGYERMWLLCDPRNRPALSSHRRVGMRTIQELEVLRIGGLLRTRLHPIHRQPSGEVAG